MVDTIKPLEISYRKSPPFIASFDFNDIAEGTGIIQFMGAKITDDGPQDSFILTTNSSIHSDSLLESGSNEAWNSMAERFNETYSVTNNLNRFMKGTAYINVPVSITAATAANKPCKVQAILKINAVEIGNVTSDTETIGEKLFLVKMELTGTQIKPEDTINLNIIISAGGSPQGTINHQFGHDPVGRLMNTLTARLSAYLPFRVEV